MNAKKLKSLFGSLPRSPGVYLMKDAKQKIIYVGKAKDLSKRVRSYFTPSTSDPRFFRANIGRLVADIEVVLTATEKEALLLENSLIKRHNPKYNIRLKDDKDYLCLKLDQRHPWPKLEVVRRPKKDGATYFGPYHAASAARETLRLVRRHFKIRSCKDRQMASRFRPCLQHQMHRCLGPCVLEVKRDEYLRHVNYVRLFLLGKRDELIDELKRQMGEAAKALEYESAAVFRDQILAVEETLTPQQVVMPGGGDQDIVGLYRQGDQVEIVILEVREGRLEGRLGFHFTGQEFPDEEILSSFIVQRYKKTSHIPDELVVSKRLHDSNALAEFLSERRGSKARVTHPRRGAKTSLTSMADLNAKQLLESNLKEEASVDERLTTIQRRLHLSRQPNRIECVDISHLGGGDTVGAISVVVDGQARRKLGRTYKVRTPVEGDDYAALKEVLTRRFIRARDKEEGWQSPDLLVVDGGRGQLGVARAVLSDLDIESQPVVSIAKERAGQDSAKSDRIFLPGRVNPVPLKARVSALHILALARDEAHRLAVRYQRKVRQKKAIGSELDRIPGVGPKLKAVLLKKLGSVKRIREASIEDLNAVPGVGPALAGKIKEAL
ncbi:MAG: excinuclease ABC subunit UvrC [Deltaproteobacteria bacterium]|nr:excinuclease ABC subunit UvrC [Deltaproteobacteria bacterium]